MVSVDYGYDRLRLQHSQSIAVPGQSRNSSTVLRAVDAVSRSFAARSVQQQSSVAAVIVSFDLQPISIERL